MTTAQILTEMPNQEFMEWGVFYALKAEDEKLAAKMAKHGR